MRDVEFKIPSQLLHHRYIHPAEFKINRGLFTRLYFEGAIKITDPAGQPVDFNNSISISYWKIRTLKRILRDVRHKCLITLLDRNHIVDVLLFQIKRESEAITSLIPGWYLTGGTGGHVPLTRLRHPPHWN